MRSMNCFLQFWFFVVSCVVRFLPRRSTFSFCATHVSTPEATDNVNVYIRFSRRASTLSQLTNQTKTQKMFKNSLNISRMVFASKAMSRRILSIVSNRKNSRLMLSHLRESEKKVKEVVPTYTKQNTFQVKAIDMTINKNEDISLPITRWSSIAFDLDLRMLRNILLNDKLWKGKDLSNKIKPFVLESLK